MRVLVVEDSPSIRQQLVRRLAEEVGARLVAEVSGEEAAVAAALTLEPDLVTLDLGLEQGSGSNVLRRLQAARFAGRIYVFSSEDPASHAAPCIELGADRYFCKLDGDDELMRAAQALSDRLDREPDAALSR